MLLLLLPLIPLFLALLIVCVVRLILSCCALLTYSFITASFFSPTHPLFASLSYSLRDQCATAPASSLYWDDDAGNLSTKGCYCNRAWYQLFSNIDKLISSSDKDIILLTAADGVIWLHGIWAPLLDLFKSTFFAFRVEIQLIGDALGFFYAQRMYVTCVWIGAPFNPLLEMKDLINIHHSRTNTDVGWLSFCFVLII